MVRSYRYSRWDGSLLPLDLDTDAIFDELLERMMEQGDLSYALEQIMREGLRLPFNKFRIKGLNQLIDEIRAWKQQKYENYSLESSFGNLQNKLENIVQKELQSVRNHFSKKYREASASPDRDGGLKKIFGEESRRELVLTQLPKNLSDAVERLSHYDFLDPQAKKDFDELKKLLGDIKALERFKNRFGHRFRGKERLNFDRARDLAREFDALEKLERMLEKGDLNSTNMDDLKKLLGDESFVSLRTLQKISRNLEEAGYIDHEGGRWTLTPEGIKKIGQRALKDIYESLTKDHLGRHITHTKGVGIVQQEESKSYEYGDPFCLDTVKTVKNALWRTAPARRGKDLLPIICDVKDFEVNKTELTARCSTALLLDMSWSMSWGSKFPAAKKVALALDHLIRTRFPNDTLCIIGFFTVAAEIKAHDLPSLDINLAEPFTNIQDGLRLADKLISRDKGANHQIILITDGQPTAYFVNGQLEVEWPVFGVSPTAFRETLNEVRRITRKGIKINTFMLDDSPSLKEFVHEMSRINRGKVFFTKPDQLGEYLLVDFLQRKTTRVH